MSLISYLSGHTFALFALYGFINGGLSSFFLPIIIFGVVPIIELYLSPNITNASSEILAEKNKNPWFHRLVLAVVPLQYLSLSAYLWFACYGNWTSLEWIGCTLSMGILCGTYGINAAHELGHRSDRVSKYSAKALLLTSLYMHFFIEHNRGHHAKVATKEDPASARLNEHFYAFWWRSVSGSFLSAWKIEARRLERKSLSAWTWQNQALRFIVIQGTFIVSVALLLGPIGLLSLITAAVLGFSLLEVVNYIEHYGLERQKTIKGLHLPPDPSPF